MKDENSQMIESFESQKAEISTNFASEMDEMKSKINHEMLLLECQHLKEIEDLKSKTLLETDQLSSQSKLAQSQLAELTSQLSSKSEKLNCKTKALEHEIESHRVSKAELLQQKDDIKVSIAEINDQISIIADKNIETKMLEDNLASLKQEIEGFKSQVQTIELE